MSSDKERICALNDELRQHLFGGCAIMTPGIAALGTEAVLRLVNAIATFDDFCIATDPRGEHHIGDFDFSGTLVKFKIDHYANDPAEPSVTERIITIMLATE